MWSSHDSYMHIAHPIAEDEQSLCTYTDIRVLMQMQYMQSKTIPPKHLGQMSYFESRNILQLLFGN